MIDEIIKNSTEKIDGYLFDALSNASENVYIFQNDIASGYSNWSKKAVEYFGLSDNYHFNVLKEWVEKIHPEDRQVYIDEVDAVFRGDKSSHKSQYRVKNKYGDYVWVECTGKVVNDLDGNMILFAGIITRIDNQSKYDSLTKRLSVDQYSISEQSKDEYTVMLLGMDGFRRIIHSYSYEAGNEILILLADELERPQLGQTVYRMNGDEFLVSFPKMTEDESRQYFKMVLTSFQNKCLKRHYTKAITFSGACETFRSKEFNKEVLLKRLEHSMEQAKILGGGQLVFFSEKIEKVHKRVYEISRALERSIENDYEGFELYFQPILTVEDGKIRTVESLLRFHTDELGWVSPDEFIPILESTGAIRNVGFWVMEEAVKQNKIWNSKYSDIKIGFNVSYLQLYNDSLVNRLIELVKEYDVKPELITLELTESCKVLYPESLSAMFEKLINHGFIVALDDFGMKNSTLTLLRDLPVNTVKIDHTFVRTILGDGSKDEDANLAIIYGIIAMCKRMSYHVVAEGVENKEVAKMMAELGVDYLQGFYYSKPVPAEEVEEFFK